MHYRWRKYTAHLAVFYIARKRGEDEKGVEASLWWMTRKEKVVVVTFCGPQAALRCGKSQCCVTISLHPSSDWFPDKYDDVYREDDITAIISHFPVWGSALRCFFSFLPCRALSSKLNWCNVLSNGPTTFIHLSSERIKSWSITLLITIAISSKNISINDILY